MATAVALRFLAGRYHATPWDRQVNEGEVEWPPSPWRLLRSFIAVWHRKVSPSGEGEEELEVLIERLAGSLPHYRLPAATHAHSRHYMPEGKYVSGDPTKDRTMVFDAWAAVDRDEELLVVWPEVDLAEAEKALLTRIVEGLGYLGRAEGWVEGRLPESVEGGADGRMVAEDEHQGLSPPLWDCLPASLAPEGSLEGGEVIRLPVAMGAESYRRWRDERVREGGLDTTRLGIKERRLLATLPPRLLDALRAETMDLRGSGWSDPPGCRFEVYRRRGDAFDPRGQSGGSAPGIGSGADRPTRRPPPTTVRFALGGRPLPRIEDAVRVGEVMRVALMANTDRRGGWTGDSESGDDGSKGENRFADRPAAIRRALELLSGHGLPKGAEHAHFLPEDADNDGHVDHILVHLAGGIPPAALRGVGRIRQIWRESDERWPAVAEAIGTAESFPSHSYLTPSAVWESVTPYLHPWFRKKGFGLEEQIRKECWLRGWGEPELERLESVKVGGKPRRPVHFHRFRSRKGLTQPDRSGSLWRLTFPEAVAGPVTLGFGRHYGLGLFGGVKVSRVSGTTFIDV